MNPLFFIAVLPDPDIQREVTEFKYECKRLFNAGHALKSPPHLTLQAPFRWAPGRLGDLKTALADFAAGQLPFPVELNSFNCFRPRVIFVDVVKNEELKTLYNELATHLANTVQLKNKRSHGFNPHMTIAHRDLDASVFPDAWGHFSQKNYRRQFRVDEIVLLRHMNHQWEVEERFGFG